jgi:hypothetical protein
MIPGSISLWSSSETPQKTKRSVTQDTENPKRWLVALDLSGKPKLSLQHPDLCEFKNCMYISGAHGDVNITANEYLQYAKEIYDAIVDLEREYPQSSIRLVCAMPTILAILVGRAIGTIFSVEITHYNRENQSYSILFRLNDSRFRYKHI